MGLPDAYRKPSLTIPEHFDGEAHGALLHPAGATGTVNLARIGPSRPWSETRIDLEDLPYVVGQLRGEPHCYLSQQRFNGWRRISRLRELGCCFQDIDFRTTERWAEAQSGHVADAVLVRLQDLGLPEPWLVHSGKGMYALWPFDPQPRQVLPRWKAMQRELKHALHGFGVDAAASADAARVLRITGTTNPKAVAEDRDVKLLHRPRTERWGFEDLAREVLPYERPQKPEEAELVSLSARRADKRSRSTGDFKPAKRLGVGTLWESRLTDLQKLRHGRWFGEIPSGWRNHWMLLAGTAMSWLSPAQVLERELYALANEASRWDFKETRQRLSAVIHRANAAAAGQSFEWNGQLYDPRYHWKTDSILELLEIDEAEQRRLGLRALVSPDVRKEHDAARKRAERRAAGAADMESYQARLENRRKRILELRAGGLTYRAIAAEIGISEDAAKKAVSRASQRG